jgi:2-iminobutanoate/2-iminopropanoate deaminase
MNRRIVSTSEAPQAIGPYSQAVAYGNLLFSSGQIGLDPESGELASGLENQVTRALENLSGVLRAAGAGAEDVVKTTVYLASMDYFGQMNEIYGRYFSESLPARSAVAVKTLPKDALFEIDAIAAIG